MGILFLSSGLFLGWSLGANDAANVFGTAVASRMVRFRTAALVCGTFVILGAVLSGGGPSRTLGELARIHSVAGAFVVALSSGLAVLAMTLLGQPVSITQAIIGGLVGWNLHFGLATDTALLARILSTWVAGPLLAAAIALPLFVAVRAFLNAVRIHLLDMDFLTRAGLLVMGAFGSYSLGANNVANVVGVFVPSAPLSEVTAGIVRLSREQVLFLLGGLAIAAGVMTFSRRVMATVGRNLFRLSPVAALVVVFSHSLVLFLFASERLSALLAGLGLPPPPLVPVSSSQVVVGAVLGIALARGGRGVRYRLLGQIALGWAATPMLAAGLVFAALRVVGSWLG